MWFRIPTIKRFCWFTFRITYFKPSATLENSLQGSLCHSEVPSYNSVAESVNSLCSTYARLLEFLSFKYPVEEVFYFFFFQVKDVTIKKVYPKQFIINRISNVKFKSQLALFWPPFWYTKWLVFETKFTTEVINLVSLFLRSSLNLSFSLHMVTGFEQQGFTMYLTIYLYQPSIFLATFSILKTVLQM